MARIARGNEALDSTLQVIASAATVEQLRQVTGLSVGWVSKLCNRYLRGQRVGDGSVPARGGRRRQNFTPEQEVQLLKPFLEKAEQGAILVVGQIKPHLEAALDRPMALSSVYALLHRHNWRKLAPDKRHPQSDPLAQEAWKKNSPKRSRTSAKRRIASTIG